jgi:acyl-CoA hydrolase
MSGEEEKIRSCYSILPMELSPTSRGRMEAGSILKAMDIKAALQAMRYCGHPCVTVFFSHVDFRAPILRDHLVSLVTEVVHTGQSSVTVEVQVYSGETGREELVFSTSGYVTLVRVGKDLKAVRDVPPLAPGDGGRKKKYEEAKRRIDFHRALNARAAESLETHRGPVEEAVNRDKEHKKIPLDTVCLMQVNPNLLNPLGTLHGGNALWMIDQAVNVCARRFAGLPNTITAAVEGIDFKRPIHLMDNVQVECRVIYARETSMILEAEVSRIDNYGTVRELSHRGYWVLVALDEDARPTPVPGLKLDDEAVRRRYLHGALRRRLWKEFGFLPGEEA